ncbi:hypothetical protein [Halobacterium noricense]|uniref:hypothetical protein n=1 Tax=Halobacterium noricense TaxID=223182 RepID=UPI001E62B60E|nr:hypothetical protein [Halobacterium noricense]UHH25490.1 hypothetical protein LT974_00760 [Halobacterium noricense]
MQRREVLAAAASLSTVVVAGCTSGDDATTSTTGRSASGTTTDSTTHATTAAPVDSDVWIDRSFTYLYAGAHYNAYTVTGDGPVFVFALVGDGEPPSLVLDGESHEPADELPGSTGADAVFSRRDTDDRRVVSYELPEPVDAASGSDGDAALDAEQLAFLSDPPEFSVTDVAAPESVQSGSHTTVTVTVKNSGGSPGTFRAAATSESISGWGLEAVTVQPDATGRLELRVPIYGENEERVNYTWGSDGGSRTIQVEK